MHGQTNFAIAIPHLETHGAATQLIVDGKPFLVLGAEVHNSSTSSLPYTEPVLAGYSSQHVNTALAAVTWGMLEPEEGKFDYSLVDGLIQEARRNKLRLILLWFGSWKNGVSTYPPLWVKTDLRRFPRALDKEGASIDVLSPFSDANRDADARAFAALMRHIRVVDSDAHTVLMVQVENEVGIFPEARDYSAGANEAFERPVPKELLDYLKQHKEHTDSGVSQDLGRCRLERRPEIGKRYLATVMRPMKSSWRGAMRGTSSGSPRRARPSTPCRCL